MRKLILTCGLLAAICTPVAEAHAEKRTDKAFRLFVSFQVTEICQRRFALYTNAEMQRLKAATEQALPKLTKAEKRATWQRALKTSTTVYGDSDAIARRECVKLIPSTRGVMSIGSPF